MIEHHRNQEKRQRSNRQAHHAQGHFQRFHLPARTAQLTIDELLASHHFFGGFFSSRIPIRRSDSCCHDKFLLQTLPFNSPWERAGVRGASATLSIIDAWR